MATIESRPLPPPGFGGQITKITEADRAAIMAQANEVIDFYLNGPGSFTPDGPRKPPVNAPVYDSTVRDLNDFKASVRTAKQFADDPNRILDFVVQLIDKTVDQLNRVAGDRDPAQSDRIKREPPDLTDQIDHLPPEDRAPTSPPSNGTVRGQPIALRTPNPIVPQGSPSVSVPQGGRRSAAPDGVSPTAFATGDTSNTPQSLFSYLMSTGDFAGVGPNSPASAVPSSPQAWQVSPPLQPDATQDAADNGPTRFLVARRYDPSQGPPSSARSAPSQPSPDGSLSLNDAYLEYLRRLNAG
jgi:hypothetical protein